MASERFETPLVPMKSLAAVGVAVAGTLAQQAERCANE